MSLSCVLRVGYEPRERQLVLRPKATPSRRVLQFGPHPLPSGESPQPTLVQERCWGPGRVHVALVVIQGVLCLQTCKTTSIRALGRAPWSQTHSKTKSLVCLRMPKPIQDWSSLGILQNQHTSPSMGPNFRLAMTRHQASGTAPDEAAGEQQAQTNRPFQPTFSRLKCTCLKERKCILMVFCMSVSLCLPHGSGDVVWLERRRSVRPAARCVPM